MNLEEYKNNLIKEYESRTGKKFIYKGGYLDNGDKDIICKDDSSMYEGVMIECNIEIPEYIKKQILGS